MLFFFYNFNYGYALKSGTARYYMFKKNSTQKLTFIFILFSLFTSLKSFSQEKEQGSFSGSTSDLKLFEHLIKHKLDSVRHFYSLYPFVDDSLMYLTALQHTNYMVDKKTLNTTGGTNSTRTVLDRIKQKGGVNYFPNDFVGNVKVLKLRKKNEYLYYPIEKIANDIVKKLIRIPNFKKCIKKKYNQVIAIAGAYDEKAKIIKFEIIIAEIKSKFVFIENTKIFTYEEPYEVDYGINELKQISRTMHKGRHAWNLRPYKRCKRCNTVSDIVRYPNNLFFYVDSNRFIHAYMPNGGVIKPFIKHRRDGLAIEMVSYKDYNCVSKKYFLKPSRRNGECIANGKILKPHYKWKLFPEWRKAKIIWNIIKFETLFKAIFSFRFKKVYPDIPKTFMAKFPGIALDWRLDSIPQNTDTIIDIDILLLKRKRVCGIVHFSDFCGEKFEKIIPLKILPEFSEVLTLKKITDTSTVKLKYYFKSGENNLSQDIQKALSDTIKSYQKDPIIKCDVKTYASIDGNTNSNLRLIDKRNNYVMAYLKTNKIDSSKIHLHGNENWNHYYLNKEKFGIKDSSFSKEQIKETLTKRKKGVKYLLDEERYVEIYFTFLKEETNNKVLADSIAELKKTASLIASKSKPGKGEIDKVIELQSKIFKSYIKNNTKLPDTLLFKFADTISCAKLITNQFYIQLKQNETIEKDSVFRKHLLSYLGIIGSNKHSSNIEKYNFNTTLINLLNSDSTHIRILNWYQNTYNNINKIKSFSSDTIEQLKLNLLFKTLSYTKINSFSDMLELHKPLEKIFNIYKRKNVNDSLILKIARLFIYYNYHSRAYQLLKIQALKSHPSPELYSLFLKMSFVHMDQDPKNQFFKWMERGKKILSKEQYCDLFIGSCNMNFQIFDTEVIRRYFCETCNDDPNIPARIKQSDYIQNR